MHCPRLLAALAAGLLLACSGSTSTPPGAPLLIAEGGIPERWTSTEQRTVEVLPAPAGWVRVRQVIPSEAWGADPLTGVYSTPIELPGAGSPPDRDGPHELRAGSVALEQLAYSASLLELDGLADGSFIVLGDSLLLMDRGGAFVSQQLEYFAWIERTGREDGKVNLPGATGDGILLLPGEVLELDLPAVGEGGPATLQFYSLAFGAEREGATTTLEIELGGERLFEDALPNQLVPRARAHRIPIASARGGPTRFGSTSGKGVVLVLNPTIVPDLPPPASAQPDVVLFLADTFRADCMEAWGGLPGITPHMNAFARESWTFLEARAPSSWTLPSQASMLTGVYPLQHGVTNSDLALAEGLPTLARSFRSAGYRTVAVTDSVLVSERFGMDSGFETFLELPSDKDFGRDTLERVRGVLELDDGRPLLLFVQSYRAHTPYVASPQTLADLPELFGEDPDPAEWEFERVKLQVARAIVDETAGRPAMLAAANERLLRLYQGGAADLDRGFGQLLELLDEEGMADALVVLTSDHGESFGEHGDYSHGTNVFEELVRVPLVIGGAGLGSGTSSTPASLIDLAPTLARLAGIEPDVDWAGRALFDPETKEPCILAFRGGPLGDPEEPSTFAVIEGSRKLIGVLDDQGRARSFDQAFDLAMDPGERDDWAAGPSSWPEELFERWRAELTSATTNGTPPKALTLTLEAQQELKAMGYLGD
ncbi:MAG: sulfatase [Planctomycetota bacterium]|nr:sulfatase [Planctomycetota bacterium]